MLFGQEHVEAYRRTDGEVGHEWRPGVFCLLLTTTGRRSGQPYTTPLIYTVDRTVADEAWVVIASKGGADEHPDWSRNLAEDRHVTIQVGAEVIDAWANDVEDGADRDRLWRRMTEVWPQFDDYQEQADREIPVVRLTRR